MIGLDITYILHVVFCAWFARMHARSVSPVGRLFLALVFVHVS